MKADQIELKYLLLIKIKHLSEKGGKWKTKRSIISQVTVSSGPSYSAPCCDQQEDKIFTICSLEVLSLNLSGRFLQDASRKEKVICKFCFLYAKTIMIFCIHLFIREGKVPPIHLIKIEKSKIEIYFNWPYMFQFQLTRFGTYCKQKNGVNNHTYSV